MLMYHKVFSIVEALKFPFRAVYRNPRFFFKNFSGIIGIAVLGILSTVLLVAAAFFGLLFVSGVSFSQPLEGFQLALTAGRVSPIALFSFFGVCIVAFLMTILCFVFFFIGFIKLALSLYENKEVTLKELFPSLKTIMKTMGGQILLAVGLFLAFLLLIVPGIIFWMIYYFLLYVLVDKNYSIIDSFKRAGLISKTIRWKLFLFSSLLWLVPYLFALIFFPLYLVPQLGLFVNLILWPFSLMYNFLSNVYVYKTLEAQLDASNPIVRTAEHIGQV